ncbi:MAG TPA: carbon starvation CstA family protein [Phycisphaerales bacterium]|nr:carbon starvation CstA family protein [Phycisphaerales bacterium]
MSLLALVTGVAVALALGYRLYGRFVAGQYRLDDAAITPAVARRDGIDFVPTPPFYLFGQHFSAIAAAGPIVGPIAACMAFGWLPCVLWIVFGVIFIGAVHDLSALVASLRHGAHSIAEVARAHLGRRAYLALAAFIWLALLYVIIAFADVTAQTFRGVTEDLAQGGGAFNLGGAVAAASTMYLLLAMAMGLVQRLARPPMWISTLVFVPATLGAIWLGTQVSTVLVFGPATWYIAILAYCFVASLLPVWLLQQPRGYLGGFVLYLAIAVALAGLLVGGLGGDFEIAQHAVRSPAGGWLQALGSGLRGETPPEAMIFPFLFVTIACGACSGFHGLVCGGTTSKQIAKESHCRPIGYGAMLAEGLVAVIALATAMIAADIPAGTPPNVVYGQGLARFLTTLLGDRYLLFATTFGTMAVATFVFDTLDVSTRLGRYLIQELLGTRARLAGVLASALTAGLPLAILLGVHDPARPGAAWRSFWTLFGTSNQLLAALTLLGVTVWLARTGRRFWYTLAPTVFVMVITLSALALQIASGVRAALRGGAGSGPALVNGAVAIALLLLALLFVLEAGRAIRRTPPTAPAGV